MPSTIEHLRKLFRLEHSNGYQNKAVIGGLATILTFWCADARNETVPEELIQAVSGILTTYGTQASADRAESLKGLWKRIQDTYPEMTPVKKTNAAMPLKQPASTMIQSLSTDTASEPIKIENQALQESSSSPLEDQADQTIQAVVPQPHADERKEDSAVPVRAMVANQPPEPEAPPPAEAAELSQTEPAERMPRPAQSANASRTVPGRSAARPGSGTSKRPIALNASLTVLAGVGPKHAAMLSRIGLNTLGDMLYNYPRRYEDYSKLKPIRDLFYGQVVTVIGEVTYINNKPLRGGKMTVTEAIINDGTAGLRLSWFNQPWMVNRLKVGEALSVSGKVEQYLGRLVMNGPEYEPVEAENLHTNRIVPIYPLTANVTQKWLRNLMHQVVAYWAPKLTDHLPESIRQAENLQDLGTALLQVHFPDSDEKLQAARQRLAFDEIFFLQTGVMRQRRDWQSVPGRVFEVADGWLEMRKKNLPFELTGAQKKTIHEIRGDLKSGKPMNRLLQGDVGSGKTVVAALGAAIVVQGGAQAAIMAPTSILAEQHYRNFLAILGQGDQLMTNAQIRLLVGDTPESEKDEIRTGLANGGIKIVIGTHALLEDPVTFADLQFITIDEQHRFGVEQRAILRSKGSNPHLLVMTATPIPRSLALTVYGDLDLSIMDELPPGRRPIETHVLSPAERERAYTLVKSQVKGGHQVFIIYPLIEESEKSELLAAKQEHERLQKEVFSTLKVGLLHGRMRPDEKEAVMLAFRDRSYDILVSTTVVEVGVDVPNATVMLVEGANHFGLAQLHQLRGRVGRAGDQSFCLLIPDHEDAAENERLQAMAESNDGFVLAERDLQQRGPGEFLGTRQAGFATTLKMANLTDVQLIEKARQQAQALFARDPELKNSENSYLAEALSRFWSGGKGDVS